MYKMVFIIVKNYTNAEVQTITVGRRELFWVRMIELGIRNKELGIRN